MHDLTNIPTSPIFGLQVVVCLEYKQKVVFKGRSFLKPHFHAPIEQVSQECELPPPFPTADPQH